MFKGKTCIGTLVLVVILFVLASHVSISRTCPAVENKDPNTVDEKMTTLRQLLTGSPMLISADALTLQIEIAKTRRLDAAILLIRSLSLSLPKPNDMDEVIQAELIPAIGLLDKYFGKDVAPLLYTEAITTRYPWLRSRIALAARTILPRDIIVQVNQVFALEEATAPSAREYLEMLNRPVLVIELPSSPSVQDQQLLQRLREIMKEKAGKSSQ